MDARALACESTKSSTSRLSQLKTNSSRNSGSQPDLRTIARALPLSVQLGLAHLSPDWSADTTADVGRVIHGLTGGSPEGFALFEHWLVQFSRRSLDRAMIELRWRNYSMTSRVRSYRILRPLLNEHGESWEFVCDAASFLEELGWSVSDPR